jgi:hypothetical protein
MLHFHFNQALGAGQLDSFRWRLQNSNQTTIDTIDPFFPTWYVDRTGMVQQVAFKYERIGSPKNVAR